MILLAGIGFEAETVDRADRESKNKFGLMAYGFTGLDQLQRLEHFKVTLETKDKIINVTACAITIANAAPLSILAQGSADIICDDGLLDIMIIRPSLYLQMASRREA